MSSAAAEGCIPDRTHIVVVNDKIIDCLSRECLPPVPAWGGAPASFLDNLGVSHKNIPEP